MPLEQYEHKMIISGMIPEKAHELSRLIVSMLAGDRDYAAMDRAKPLNQLLATRRAA